ncbi:hypothetical protein [Plantactinospora sp. WMMB782]|uniref:hypothetical protein n=1 Tax=Plantactinospora sp. WMMB782 TaxID=3404121 RepID=UPI003B94D221
MTYVQPGIGRARIGVIALVSLLAALASALVAPTPASAAPSCTSPSHNVNGEGSGILVGTYNLKSAPYSHCSTITSVPQRAEIYYHCWYQNAYGNWWVYGRIAGTSTSGWMSGDNLQDTWLDDDGDGVYEEGYC